MKSYNTIDAHVAGESVRLLVSGAPVVGGQTMTEKLAWMRRHGDELRRTLMLEPRGHSGMHGALLTEPGLAGAHAGILAMHAGGFPMLSGESILAAAKIALQHKLIVSRSAGHEGIDDLVFDTPAGLASVRCKDDSLELTSLPSFVFSAGLSLQLRGRRVPVDVAFAGEFYAIVDSEAVGIPLDIAHGPQLVAAGKEIKRAVESLANVVHPAESGWKGIHGTIVTGPPHASGADLRSATVLDEGVLRRSPGVTSTCALLAVLDAMGLVAGDQTLVHEGIAGTVLRGRVVDRKESQEVAMLVAAVESSVWVTGHHEFIVEDGDDYLSSTAAR
jgi:proline racemase